MDTALVIIEMTKLGLAAWFELMRQQGKTQDEIDAEFDALLVEVKAKAPGNLKDV